MTRWLVLVALVLTGFVPGCASSVTVSQIEPVPTELVPTEPVQIELVPTEPVPTEPVPTQPVQIGPAQTDPDPYTVCGVPNFAWTDRHIVARASQPLVQSLDCLRNVGISAVVNLRDEDPADREGAPVEALGMVYLYLPIVNDMAPSPTQVTEYLAFIEARRSAGQATLVHCAAGRGRAGVMEGIYLLWQGWSTGDVFDRYLRLGGKIGCDKGGYGQIQALHEIGLLLGRGDAWPRGADQSGSVWENCPRPDYMAGWDYSEVVYPTVDGDLE